MSLPRRARVPALALLVGVSLGGLAACGSASTARVTLRLGHAVDGAALVFDDVRYTNAAGNEYSVTRLEYYLSRVVLRRAAGAAVTLPEATYCNAREAAWAERTLTGIPPGDYTGMTLFLGLGPDLNLSGKLPNTVENVGMAWPEPMGGGYHFLKLEGHWRDSPSTTAGFAMHLGTNGALVTVNLDQAFTVKDGSVLALTMNLNEWFRSPANFDFGADGNYTMGNQTAMGKLRDNGADAVTLEVR